MEESIIQEMIGFGAVGVFGIRLDCNRQLVKSVQCSLALCRTWESLNSDALHAKSSNHLVPYNRDC